VRTAATCGEPADPCGGAAWLRHWGSGTEVRRPGAGPSGSPAVTPLPVGHHVPMDPAASRAASHAAQARAPRPIPPPGLVYLAVLAGGVLGGSTRYLIGLAIPAQPGQIPWGILGVNLTGAFIMGLLLHGWVRRGHVSHPWRPFLATGILGSFTTWSTFMADTYNLARDGAGLLAGVYVLGATAAGVTAAALGWWAAERVVPEVPDVAVP
jgi:fluoride exporter